MGGPRDAVISSATVLVVDHDPGLRLTARRLLESEGYVVLDAGDATGAEQIATLYVRPIHVLVVELDEPTIGARTLAERLRGIHPEMRVIFASDRPRRELAGRVDARAPIVRRPFDKSRLAAKLRTVLSGPL
jgi:DNA-binding response OmpR family regulator